MCQFGLCQQQFDRWGLQGRCTSPWQDCENSGQFKNSAYQPWWSWEPVCKWPGRTDVLLVLTQCLFFFKPGSIACCESSWNLLLINLRSLNCLYLRLVAICFGSVASAILPHFVPWLCKQLPHWTQNVCEGLSFSVCQRFLRVCQNVIRTSCSVSINYGSSLCDQYNAIY